MWSLAESRAAQTKARQRTRGLRQPGSQGHVPRAAKGHTRKVGQRRTAQGPDFYPLLKWLDIEKQLTPWVWTTTARHGWLHELFALAQDTLAQFGIVLSTTRVKRRTYSFGQLGIDLRQGQIR